MERFVAKNGIGILLLLFTVVMYWVQVNADFRAGIIYISGGLIAFAAWAFFRVTGRL